MDREQLEEWTRGFRASRNKVPGPVNGKPEPQPVGSKVSAEINRRTYERRMERMRLARNGDQEVP